MRFYAVIMLEACSAVAFPGVRSRPLKVEEPKIFAESAPGKEDPSYRASIRHDQDEIVGFDASHKGSGFAASSENTPDQFSIDALMSICGIGQSDLVVPDLAESVDETAISSDPVSVSNLAVLTSPKLSLSTSSPALYETQVDRYQILASELNHQWEAVRRINNDQPTDASPRLAGFAVIATTVNWTLSKYWERSALSHKQNVLTVSNRSVLIER